MENNNKAYLLIIFSIFSLLILGGTSYALITKSNNIGNYIIETGDFTLSFENTNSNSVTLSNLLPAQDDIGINGDVALSFSVRNNGDYESQYSLSLYSDDDSIIIDNLKYAVSINNGNDIIASLRDSKYIIENKDLGVNESDSYSLKFWLSYDASADVMNESAVLKVKLTFTQSKYKYATNIIKELYNDNDNTDIIAIGEDGNLYESGNIREYRYNGSSANNYVWFNCDNGYTSGSACEKWRIIGSFKNTYDMTNKEKEVLAIAKDENFYSRQFNSYVTSYDEPLNFVGSSTEEYLNYEYYDTIKNDYKQMIAFSKFNFGNIYSYDNLSTIYQNEAMEEYWGYVGMINITDWIYSLPSSYWNSISIDTEVPGSWFQNYQNFWFMNNGGMCNWPHNNITVINQGYYTSYANMIPKVYLNPDVSIINGYGTIDEPYQLKVLYPIEKEN